MSDTSPSYPPPPPPSIPPPVYQGPAASPMPDYQPPPVAQPPVGYPQTWQQNRQQGIGAGAATAGIISQFSGRALWACGIGLVTIYSATFDAIETANILPNFAGSVRRWRSVRNAISKGVSTRPATARARATATIDEANGRNDTAMAIASSDTAIS